MSDACMQWTGRSRREWSKWRRGSARRATRVQGTVAFNSEVWAKFSTVRSGQKSKRSRRLFACVQGPTQFSTLPPPPSVKSHLGPWVPIPPPLPVILPNPSFSKLFPPSPCPRTRLHRFRGLAGGAAACCGPRGDAAAARRRGEHRPRGGVEAGAACQLVPGPARVPLTARPCEQPKKAAGGAEAGSTRRGRLGIEQRSRCQSDAASPIPVFSLCSGDAFGDHAATPLGGFGLCPLPSGLGECLDRRYVAVAAGILLDAHPSCELTRVVAPQSHGVLGR